MWIVIDARKLPNRDDGRFSWQQCLQVSIAGCLFGSCLGRKNIISVKCIEVLEDLRKHIHANTPLRTNADYEQLNIESKNYNWLKLACAISLHTHTHYPPSHCSASVPTAGTWIPSGP